MSKRVWLGAGAEMSPIHQKHRKNRQDMVWAKRWGPWMVGALSDGCSEADMAEIGAGNIATIAAQTLLTMAMQRINIEKGPCVFQNQFDLNFRKFLASMPLGQKYLDWLTSYRHGSPVKLGILEDMHALIARAYQATLLAVLCHEELGGFIVARGDGSINVDGEITVLENFKDNEGRPNPPYLAYDYSPIDYPGPKEHLEFTTKVLSPDFKFAAIASDGWHWDFPRQPFGRYQPDSFGDYIGSQNAERSHAGLPLLTEQEAWEKYNPEHIENLLRWTGKQKALNGEPIVDDDMALIVIEKET